MKKKYISEVTWSKILKFFNKQSLTRLLLNALLLSSPNAYANRQTHLELAKYFQQNNKLHNALYHYKKAQKCGSTKNASFDIPLNMGKIYEHLRQLDKALAYFKQALAHRPNDKVNNQDLAGCFLNLGRHFFNERSPDKAVETFEQALTISQRFAAIHHNIGFTLTEQTDKFAAAITAFEKSLALKPNVAETHFCYALALLANGNLEKGWQEYAWRWKRGSKSPRSFSKSLLTEWANPQQLHNYDIAGKRVCVRVEQGLGDTLQFIRYAQLLKQAGATVIVETQRPLAQLLSLCDYIDEIIPIGDTLPPFDLQIPTLNLPHAFATSLTTIPANIPYLFAQQDLIEQWRHQLAHDTNFKIGIC